MHDSEHSLSRTRIIEIRHRAVRRRFVDPLGHVADEHLARALGRDGGAEHLPVGWLRGKVSRVAKFETEGREGR